MPADKPGTKTQARNKVVVTDNTSSTHPVPPIFSSSSTPAFTHITTSTDVRFYIKRLKNNLKWKTEPSPIKAPHLVILFLQLITRIDLVDDQVYTNFTPEHILTNCKTNGKYLFRLQTQIQGDAHDQLTASDLLFVFCDIAEKMGVLDQIRSQFPAIEIIVSHRLQAEVMFDPFLEQRLRSDFPPNEIKRVAEEILRLYNQNLTKEEKTISDTPTSTSDSSQYSKTSHLDEDNKKSTLTTNDTVSSATVPQELDRLLVKKRKTQEIESSTGSYNEAIRLRRVACLMISDIFGIPFIELINDSNLQRSIHQSSLDFLTTQDLILLTNGSPGARVDFVKKLYFRLINNPQVYNTIAEVGVKHAEKHPNQADEILQQINNTAYAGPDRIPAEILNLAHSGEIQALTSVIQSNSHYNQIFAQTEQSLASQTTSQLISLPYQGHPASNKFKHNIQKQLQSVPPHHQELIFIKAQMLAKALENQNLSAQAAIKILDQNPKVIRLILGPDAPTDHEFILTVGNYLTDLAKLKTDSAQPLDMQTATQKFLAATKESQQKLNALSQKLTPITQISGIGSFYSQQLAEHLDTTLPQDIIHRQLVFDRIQELAIVFNLHHLNPDQVVTLMRQDYRIRIAIFGQNVPLDPEFLNLFKKRLQEAYLENIDRYGAIASPQLKFQNTEDLIAAINEATQTIEIFEKQRSKSSLIPKTATLQDLQEAYWEQEKNKLQQWQLTAQAEYNYRVWMALDTAIKIQVLMQIYEVQRLQAINLMLQLQKANQAPPEFDQRILFQDPSLATPTTTTILKTAQNDQAIDSLQHQLFQTQEIENLNWRQRIKNKIFGKKYQIKKQLNKLKSILKPKNFKKFLSLKNITAAIKGLNPTTLALTVGKMLLSQQGRIILKKTTKKVVIAITVIPAALTLLAIALAKMLLEGAKAWTMTQVSAANSYFVGKFNWLGKQFIEKPINFAGNILDKGGSILKDGFNGIKGLFTKSSMSAETQAMLQNSATSTGMSAIQAAASAATSTASISVVATLAATYGFTQLNRFAIQQAFLLNFDINPDIVNVSPFDEEYSPYIEVNKLAAPESIDNNTKETITYILRFSPKDDYEIKPVIDQTTDEFAYIGGDPLNLPDQTDVVREQIKQALEDPNTGELRAITSADPLEISYQVEMEGIDVLVSNTFTMNFEVINATQSAYPTADPNQATTPATPSSVITDKIIASASVRIGDPEIGCFVFGDPHEVVYEPKNIISTPWTNEEKLRLQKVFAKKAGTSPKFVELLCSKGDLTIYRSHREGNAGGRATTKGVVLYDLAFRYDTLLGYTTIHEFGHFIDYRNSGLSQKFQSDLNWIKGISNCYTYPMPKFCKISEAFAESITLNAYYKNYHFKNRGSKTYPEWPEEYPDVYNWVKTNIYGGIEF